MTIGWNEPVSDGGSEVIGYHVERKERNSIVWHRISKALVIGNLFKSTGLEDGVAYEFRVIAENIAGIGKPSKASEPMLALDPVDPPGQPVPIHVSKNAITIQWTKPEYDGGFKITGYTVEKRDLPSGRWMRANFTNIIETTFTISGLTQDESYEFRVFARNSAGAVSNPSDPSDPIICKDDIEEPRIMVDAKFKDIVLVKAGELFKLEADVAGQPLPSMVWTKDGKDVENTSKLQIKMTELTAFLINKDSVRRDGGEFILTATNVGGFAKHVFNVKVLDRPGPPKGPLTVSDISAEKCVLTWNPPSDDGGANIEHYVIEKRESSRLAWTNVASELQVNQYQVTKLLKGNEYIFRVMAVNKYGVGEPLESEAIIAENPYVRPDPPQTPEITAVTKDSVVLCWGAPASNGGSEITNYLIEKRDRISLRWVKCNKRNVTDLHFKVSALVPSHEYEFRVFAENAAGISDPSPSSPFVKATDALFKPGPPGNPRILDTTSSAITLAWNKPVYDGGSEITGYILETCLPGTEEEEWTIVSPKDGVKGTSFTITNLKENQEYKINVSAFRVIARNAAGVFSDPSYSTGPIMAKDEIEPPRISIDPEYTQTIVVNAGDNFKIDADIHGKPTPSICWIKGEQELGNTMFREIKSTDNYACLSVKEAKLEDGGQYTLLLKNPGGEKSVQVSICVLDKPGPPEGPISITGVTSEQCCLSWKPPKQDGGSKIIHYIVEKRETSRLLWTVVEPKVQALYLKIVKLLEGNEYVFRILPVNKFGVGEPLQSSAVVIKNPFTPPDAPKGVEVSNVKKDSMVITWEAPTNDGGTHITGYIIEKHDKEGIRWTRCNMKTVTNLTFKVTGLLENHLYEFRVSAENAAGVSEASSANVFYKALDPVFKPGPPHNPKVLDMTKSSVVLAWGKPIYDGGCEIQGYIVEACESKAVADEWTMCSPPTGVKLTPVISNLNPGEEYTFRVIAINEKGKSDPRTLAVPVQAKDLVFGPDVRPAFSNYSVLVKKDLQVEIPVSGRPKPKVTWTKDGAALKFTTRVNISNTAHSTVLSIKEAAREDGGMYGINLSNVVGQKDATIEIITLDKPGPPTGPVRFDEITVSSITLSWDPPKYTGGCPVSNYIVQKRDTTSTTWENVAISLARTKLKVIRLKTGAEYQFRIIAQNRYGKSYALDSSTVVAQYPYREPGPPGTPFVSSLSKDHMVVEWNEPVSDGGRRWMKASFTNVIETNFTVTGLTEGAKYDFRVIAKNAVGTISKPSYNSGPIAALDEVEPPKFSIDPEYTQTLIVNAGDA
uniref:Titin n=1 Tax=Cyprinus carpio TaxID=7962 RepID=A0A8C1WEY3_CYPCA